MRAVSVAVTGVPLAAAPAGRRPRRPSRVHHRRPELGAGQHVLDRGRVAVAAAGDGTRARSGARGSGVQRDLDRRAGLRTWPIHGPNVPNRLGSTTLRDGGKPCREATSRHLPGTLATRLRTPWRFKSSHPHLASKQGKHKRRATCGPRSVHEPCLATLGPRLFETKLFVAAKCSSTRATWYSVSRPPVRFRRLEDAHLTPEHVAFGETLRSAFHLGEKLSVLDRCPARSRARP
jgi:hypothetical protein